MKKILECVPNFSVGKNQKILDAISDSIKKIKNVKLLDVDPGEATNRTVFTFAGEPESVVNAAFSAIKTASELIDMSLHKGEHPRIGATDVCPLIPIANISVDEAVEFSKLLAKRIGEELRIPIYLYEHSTENLKRKNLADIRKGEYEGLSEKIKLPEWKPDFGPAEFNSKSGATVIGVRDFLIAYNVNLNIKDKTLANEIAFRIREQGRAKRDSAGNILKDEKGESIKIPGTLKNVKAVGWVIEEYNRAQVSINLTNYKITPPHIAFEECKKEATQLGILATGSELIGLIPKEAMLMAGKFYLKNNDATEIELIESAIKNLKLNELSEFNPKKKIIEYVLEEDNKLLTNLSVNDFINELSSNSPAPGGGSASALSGAIAASLVEMVANLTIGKKGYENVQIEILKISEQARKLKTELLILVDEDTNAFKFLMDAFRLPKNNESEKEIRINEIERATINAAKIPLNTMEKCVEVFNLSKIVGQIGNKNAISDSGVAQELSRAGFIGARLNVEINFDSIKSEVVKKEITEKINLLNQTIQ